MTRNGDEEDDPVRLADRMSAANVDRTLSPRVEAMQGAPSSDAGREVEGQLGPDELSDPEEVVMNKEAKEHLPEADVAPLPREELVDTGVRDLPAVANDDIDPLTREDVEADPGEATRKLPKNDQSL